MREIEEDNLDEALKLVDIQYESGNQPRSAPVGLRGCTPFGDLIPFSSDERKQLESLCDLITRFVMQQGPAHPLCLAAFGPPGSGKSFAVRQIRKKAAAAASVELPFITINLTQVSSPAELAAALAKISKQHSQQSTVPLVFFDEFDSARDGAAYGWLSWFLAPMNDGEFLYEGEKVELKKAIYVFAGGTADTFDEFSSRQRDPVFRVAKGPDFVSRLRGFLDVPGPNAPPRMLRRATIIRAELQSRATRHGTVQFTVDQPLLRALLQTGRYRHGARSISALIEFAELKAVQDELSWDRLPEDHLVALQVDHGALDHDFIGGAIALSGFYPGKATRTEATDGLKRCWTEVAERLWDEGATLTYGGRLRDYESDLTGLLIDVLSRRPSELSRNESVRDKPYPRFLHFLHDLHRKDVKKSKAEAEASESDLTKTGVRRVAATYLDQVERQWAQRDHESEEHWKARTIERFRRRLAVSEASVARFIIGGDPTPSGNRPSGIIEETILSLALNHPIYVAGGFGGAACDLGVALGLANIRTGAVPHSLEDQLASNERQWLLDIADRLRPPPLTSLPVLPQQQIEFLHEHALDGGNWPGNGLTASENRKLFSSDNPKDVADLIASGLLRLFGRR